MVIIALASALKIIKEGDGMININKLPPVIYAEDAEASLKSVGGHSLFEAPLEK